MEIRPITNDADHQWALEQIDEHFQARPGTPEADHVEALITLVRAYEAKHHPLPDLDPIEAIKFYMEQNNMTRKDLEAFIGTRARVSEVLNRKRSLSLPMIRKLYSNLKIPAETLIQESRT